MALTTRYKIVNTDNFGGDYLMNTLLISQLLLNQKHKNCAPSLIKHSITTGKVIVTGWYVLKITNFNLALNHNSIGALS